MRVTGHGYTAAAESYFESHANSINHSSLNLLQVSQLNAAFQPLDVIA